MSILRHIIAVTVFAVGIGTAWAQSITESVTVEGKYTPDILPADRLALLPNTVTLIAPESNMTYDRKGVMADFAPDALNLPATGWRAKKVFDVSKGYIDFTLGSWLNSSLSAGYNAIDTQDTRLNFYLQHNSTSLWQAWQADPADNTPASDRRFRYDETIGARLQHKVADAGTLHAGVKYHLGYFNYFTAVSQSREEDRYKAPTQTVNDLGANIRWAASPSERLSYNVEADVRHFAYRAAYNVAYLDSRTFVKEKGQRETLLNAGGNAEYSLSEKSSINAALFYSGVINAIGNNVNRLRFTPGYELKERKSTLHLGVDLAVTADGKSRFRIAPDIWFSTRSGIMAFSAKIGGGTHLRTLAWMHMMDYYSDPLAGCTKAAYSPLDVNLALQLNPGGKWTFGVDGSWRTTFDESFGGLYAALLNGCIPPTESPVTYGRIRGFSIAVNAGYEFNRYLGLAGKIAWQPQDGEKGFLNGFDRPAVTADFSAKSRPIDKLSLSLDYRLRAKRQLGLGRFSRLDLTGEYRITDKISAFAEFCNLLNRRQEILPGIPLEGFNAAAGLQILF